MGYFGQQLEQQLPGHVDHKIHQALQVFSQQYALPNPLHHPTLPLTALLHGSDKSNDKAIVPSWAVASQSTSDLASTGSCPAEGARQGVLAVASAKHETVIVQPGVSNGES